MRNLLSTHIAPSEQPLILLATNLNSQRSPLQSWNSVWWLLCTRVGWTNGAALLLMPDPLGVGGGGGGQQSPFPAWAVVHDVGTMHEPTGSLTHGGWSARRLATGHPSWNVVSHAFAWPGVGEEAV